jgi:nucleoside-diphosphate kinase
MKTLQRTLAIVKPDAVNRNAVGDIISMIESKGFRLLGIRMLDITRKQAEGFYAVHAGKPFFESLTQFMSSGPIVVMALEREDAIKQWRDLMGATNPANATEGTVRRKWGANIENNAVHGSDAEDTARFELSYFFPGFDLVR